MVTNLISIVLSTASWRNRNLLKCSTFVTAQGGSLSLPTLHRTVRLLGEVVYKKRTSPSGGGLFGLNSTGVTFKANGGSYIPVRNRRNTVVS